jgi:hypothetical protein
MAKITHFTGLLQPGSTFAYLLLPFPDKQKRAAAA